MKAKLIIALSAREQAVTNGQKHDREYWIRIEKCFKIPFVPFIGLQMRFDKVSTDQEKSISFPETENCPVDPCFNVYAIDYDSLKKQFVLHAGRSCGNWPDLISAVTQFEKDYGFQKFHEFRAIDRGLDGETYKCFKPIL